MWVNVMLSSTVIWCLALSKKMTFWKCRWAPGITRPRLMRVHILSRYFRQKSYRVLLWLSLFYLVSPSWGGVCSALTRDITNCILQRLFSAFVLVVPFSWYCSFTMLAPSLLTYTSYYMRLRAAKDYKLNTI